MEELINVAGKVAGLAGIALIMFMFVARDFITKNVFSGLGKSQAYRLWRNLIWVLLIITVIAILAWLSSVLLAPRSVSVADVSVSIDGQSGNNVLTWHVPCPVSVKVTGDITAEGTGYVKYQFVRKISISGEELPTEPQTIYFNGALKTLKVFDNVPVPYGDKRDLYYSVYLRILEPGNRESNPVGFTVWCDPNTPPAPAGMPPPPELPPGFPPPPLDELPGAATPLPSR